MCTRRAPLLLLGLVAGLTAGAAPATADEVSAAREVLPPRIEDWLPRDWWVPVQAVGGRIDEDAYDDLVVLVERRTDAPDDPAFPRGSRGLFILFGDAVGGWRRGQLAAGLLPCVDCLSTLGGTIGSAVFDLEVSEDGLVEVGWLERGRLTKAVQLQIGWDQTHRALGLYSDDIRIIRPQGGRSHVRRDYRAGRMWVDGVPRPMPARFIPIEHVLAQQY
ncbi:MAG: hypothetical protein LJE69_11120 [Thiohalocapsa sp.]|uniref:hypothetical protein n=1 Tax=Thiohalocapsa sp. TaxID=2497641 RepID=UPI0025EE5391|nr:hypothetical protein [Thiohalocapsa sp.]MCG6941785.1 hypothetical protein [Thiohalocapsa sp.]